MDQQYWARPQPGQPGPEEKESGKWINGLDASRAILYETAGDRPVPRLIHVMDREGDTYEVMMTIVDAGDSHHPLCPEPPDRRPAGQGPRGRAEPAGAVSGVDRGGSQDGRSRAVCAGGSAVDAG